MQIIYSLGGLKVDREKSEQTIQLTHMHNWYSSGRLEIEATGIGQLRGRSSDDSHSFHEPLRRLLNQVQMAY